MIHSHCHAVIIPSMAMVVVVQVCILLSIYVRTFLELTLSFFKFCDTIRLCIGIDPKFCVVCTYCIKFRFFGVMPGVEEGESDLARTAREGVVILRNSDG